MAPPQYTPVIPPRPSPEGATSPIPDPPVIPSMSPQNQPNNIPNWGRPTHPQASPGGFPGYFNTPYPQPGMAMPPGSYYIAPVALPQGGATPAASAVGNHGVSADWEGFPTNGAPGAASLHPGTPWGFPGPAPAAFGTPYPPQPMAFAVPGWPTPGGPPGAFTTPFVQTAAVPGAWATPYPVPNQQLPPGFPQPNPPHPQPQNHNPRGRPVRPAEDMPPIEKFAEHPRCKLPIPFFYFILKLSHRERGGCGQP